MDCPICNKKLSIIDEYTDEFGGIEEYHEECKKCKLFEVSYAFGNYEIKIGAFITGYSYRDDIKYKNELKSIINKIGEIYKNKIKLEIRKDD